jgi:serine protease AprX
LFFTATAVWGGNERLSSDLQSKTTGRRAGGSVEVIVQYKVSPTEAHHRRIAALGGRLNAKMDFIKGAHYTVPTSALATIAEDPDVAYMTPNRTLNKMLDITAQATNTAAAYYAYGLLGKGVGVAVIDSGIDNSLGQFTDDKGGNRIVYQQSFVGGTADDQYGHGSHVAGIIGAHGVGTNYVGIASFSTLINLRVLDQNGSGTDANVIQAIDKAISLKGQYNIRVMNLSLGRPVYESAAQDPLCQAVEAAWKAGIVVVVAAGNDGRDNTYGTYGYGTIAAPGNDPYVITVGAMKTNGTNTRADDSIASYSSKGPTLFDHTVKPDLVAPGNRITSSMAPKVFLSNTYPSIYRSPYWYQLSGTSMATPVVSGAAALLIQQNPSITPDQIKARLMKTATKNFPFSTTAVDPVTHVA